MTQLKRRKLTSSASSSWFECALAIMHPVRLHAMAIGPIGVVAQNFRLEQISWYPVSVQYRPEFEFPELVFRY